MAYILVVLLLHLLRCQMQMLVLRIGRTARPVFLSFCRRYRISLQHRQSIFIVNINGVFNKDVRRERYDFYKISSRRDRDTIGPRLGRLIRLRRFAGFIRPRFFLRTARFHFLDKFPRKSYRERRTTSCGRWGMVDGWRVERLNSFLPLSRLNKTTFSSDGWKRYRRNYLSLSACSTSIRFEVNEE